MNVSVIIENIATVKSDALITAINSSGMWFGGIDGVIYNIAGNYFHNRLAHAIDKGLGEGEAFLAKGVPTSPTRGFNDVIFVIDNLQKKLHEIVLAGLNEAEKNQLASVTLPTLRMGVMLGVVEKTEEEAIEEMAMAIRLFKSSNPAYVKNITFVVYSNQNILRKLTTSLGLIIKG